MFLMTDGTPSDARAYGEAVKEVQRRSFGSIIACAVGPKAGHEHLKLLTDKVVALETLDSTAFSGFFKWVSAPAWLQEAPVPESLLIRTHFHRHRPKSSLFCNLRRYGRE